MRWLSELSVRRAVLAWVIILSLTFLGNFFYRRLNVERFPNVDLPFVTVSTRLPGASPEEVETDVTNRVEEAVNTISGIDTLTSTSSEGFSLVAVQFVLEKDINVAAQDVRDKINGVLPNLPAGIDPPVISKLDPGAVPVYTLALSSDQPIRDTTEYADKVFKRQLEGTPGVGSVDIVGGQARQINVWIDPSRLNAYGVSATSIIQALQTQNIQVPGGNIDQGAQRLTLRTLGRVDSIAELERIVVATRAGAPVRLADVARVEDGAAEPQTIANVNGQPAVVLNIVKQSGTNTINVVRDIKARLASITTPPGYRLQVISDQSIFVEASTRAVQEHLMVGSLLAAVVVLLFLRDWRATIIAAIAIPTSLISTFTFMSAMGLTLNVVTLLALALVVGVVIDDAIVVLENIYRFIREKKMPPFQAAIEATREVGGAVTSTTMSLIAVFLPLAFMGGIVGRFMRSFGYTMAFSIAVSLLVSFTLTPMLSSRWLRGSGSGPASSTGEARGGRIYMALENAYRWLLQRALRRRWVVVVLSLLVLFSMAPLGIAVNKNFFPDEDESQFEAIVRAPEGWSLQTTERLATQISSEIRRISGVDYTMVSVAEDPLHTPNRATIYAHMVEIDKRITTQAAAVDSVRKEILPKYAYLGLQTQVGPVSAFGGSGGFQPVDYVISGPDLATLTRVAEQGQAIMRKIPGVVDVRSSLITGKPQLGVSVDRARAADLGVSVANAASALNTLVAGQKASTYADQGEQYDIVVRAAPAYRGDLADLTQLQVGSTTQGVVPLEQVVQIKPGVGPSTIDHYNRRRRVELTANLLPSASQSAVLTQLDSEIHKLGLGPNYTTAFAGQAAEQGRQAQAFLTAFGLSFVFMYLILAAQFESWLHPITILLSLPLTVPFAMLSILFLRDSLNILSQLGILVLFGVVKKNAILQIDHANQLRAAGLEREEAIVAASRDRLRPILMTTIAFVAGMIPLAISSGVGSGTNRSISSVVIGGQTLSLLLTLVAIPVFYSLFDDLSKVRVFSRLAVPVLAGWSRVAGAVRGLARRPAAEPVPSEEGK